MRIFSCQGEHHCCLPVPSSHKALLHVQTDIPHRTMNGKQMLLTNGRQEEVTQRRHNRKPFRSQKTDRTSKMTRLIPREQLSQAENERISDIIDRQRCSCGNATLVICAVLSRGTKQLEEWREETKRQRQQQHSGKPMAVLFNKH